MDRSKILKGAESIGVVGKNAHGAPQILAELCGAEVNARRVVGLLRQEPALYARVLKVANSPYYGQTRTITTVDRALVLLGLDAVRGIAAAACMDRTMLRGTGALFDMKALVEHSLATAAAAESLARIRRPELAAEAFIAGLLHNLGVVVQMHLDSPGVQAMVNLRKADDPRELRALEAERAQVSHEECVAVVFDAWHLPESLIVATSHHHDPMTAGELHRELASLVNLGATLGLATGSTYTLEPKPGPPNEPAMSWLGVDLEQVNRVATELPERVEGLKHALMEG